MVADASALVRRSPQLLGRIAETSRVESQSQIRSRLRSPAAHRAPPRAAAGCGPFAIWLGTVGFVGLVVGCPDVRQFVEPRAAEGGACSDCAGAAGGARVSNAMPALRRVDLRVLVLSAADVGTDMLRSGLREAGVPFTEVDLDRAERPPITDAFLSDESPFVRHAKFQAIVAPNAAPPQLSAAESEALARFQREFGVRRVDGYVYPSAATGLNTPAFSGTLDGMAGRPTADALAGPFGYLAGGVPFDDVDLAVPESYGYLAQPLAAGATAQGQSFRPLLEARIPGSETQGVLIGVLGDAGREELVITCAMNATQFHQQALFPGILSWMTYGVYLGTQRNYLTVHVDDVLLSDARWIAEYNCTRGNDCPAGVTASDISLAGDDVDFLNAWQATHQLELSLVFNGGAYDSLIEDAGAYPVGDALLATPSARWVNHTYTHEYLGCARDQTRVGFPCQRDAAGAVSWVPLQVASDEIGKNLEFARVHALAVDPSELVTGEHSGLRRAPEEPSDNPHLLEALRARGIAWIASDASREREQREVTGARTVPRYPMNLFFNVGRREELVDELNWIHSDVANGGSGACAQRSPAACLAPLDVTTGFESWIVPREARAMLLHALSNDPRPHFAHQSNIAEDRLLYPVLERALADYRRVFGPDVPLVPLTLAQAGAELRDQADWVAHQADVSAYVEAGTLTVTVSGSGALRVPFTLPPGSHVSGDAAMLPGYGGQQTGWRSVRPMLGQTVTLPASVGYAR